MKSICLLASRCQLPTSSMIKMSVQKHYELNKTFNKIGEKNYWVELGALAKQYNATNLGQGFPNYQSFPRMNEMIEEVLSTSTSLIHQYTRSQGNLTLVNAVAKYYSHFSRGRKIDPLTEVLITVGAFSSLYNAFTGLLEKGDEVIIIEPFFDCYAPMSILAGAKCVFVPLKPKASSTDDTRERTSAEWSWDDAELEAAFTPKTKLIIINTPNNPLGKVYSQKELEQVAALCIKHNVICISDEVYEHIVYDDREQIKIASLPGMWERTLSIGSAGKSFSSTGVEIGWTIGPKELIRLCQVVQNNTIYVCPTFFQEVVGRCLEREEAILGTEQSYFTSISKELKPKRDRLAHLLQEAGLTPILPEGGYFMLADISKLAEGFSSDEAGGEMKDVKFVKYLTREKGLATIPASIFYSNEHKHYAENFIRFCFIKSDDTIEKAADVLSNLNL